MSDNSLLNKKLDPYGTLWKKKYILLLKRTESIEKLNLRLVNRLNQLKKISKNLQKERWYCQEIRDEVDEQNPGISRQDLTKVISYKWNAMSSSDKEIYFDLFDKDKQRYEEEMKQYTQQIAQQNTEKTGNPMNIDFKNSGSSRSSKLENISLSSSNNGLSFDDDNNASTVNIVKIICIVNIINKF
ncbi:FACT complex subunit SSRP1-A isoform X5 [Hydra vulgaris]|uniref:FACT complex subunit SSRP1-A isoform X5 n=1 Tax=Hydra vulgaris TaxID=6087 RepID=A0ABM4CDA0_HYDVU